MTTYYDVLRMSLMFDNWYSAFVSLMGIFGLPAVEFPPPLRAQLKGKDAYRGLSDTMAPHNVNMLNPTLFSNPTTSIFNSSFNPLHNLLTRANK